MARLIVWDWNGTLIDDVEASVTALNRMLAARNLTTVTKDFYRAHFGFPVRDFYAELGVDLAHEDWDILCKDYHRFFAEGGFTIRPDARAALDAARARGFRQVILSALRQDILLKDSAPLADRFEKIFGVDNLDGASKLARGRELFAALAQEPFEGAPVFIGDTLHDAEVARALGGKCVLYSGGHQDAARLAEAGCPVASTLVDAVEYASQC